MTSRFPLVLLLACSCTCLSIADDKKDSTSIDGTWLPSDAELGGEKFPEEIRKTIKLMIADGKYTVTVGKQVDKGTVKYDNSKTPKTLDIVGMEGPNQGKTILAIYELKDNTLRTCYDLSGKARPTEFKSTKGTQQFLVTYKRE